MLCETCEGYQNLCQLIKRFKLWDNQAGRLAKLAELEQYSGALVCLAGGEEDPIAAALMSGGETAGRALVETLIPTFGKDNVYVELQRHR